MAVASSDNAAIVSAISSIVRRISDFIVEGGSLNRHHQCMRRTEEQKNSERGMNDNDAACSYKSIHRSNIAILEVHILFG